MTDFQGEGEDTGFARPLSRRELLKRGAAGAAVAGALPLVGAGAASAASTKGGLSAADIATIRKIVGPINPKFSGKGETWHVGAILPFTTGAGVYGIVQGNGVKLAVKHIKQLGGPNIQVDYRDHAGGDVVKGRNAVLAYEGKGIGAIISSYGGVIGAIIPEVGRKHLLTLDPGGGNSAPFDKKPYFWGFRGEFGYDGMPLHATYLRDKLKGKRFLLVFSDYGAITLEFVKRATSIYKQYGIEVAGVVKPKPSATDYSNELASVRAQAKDFDAISLGIVGFDIGYFLKQYKTAGIDKPVFSWEAMLFPTAKIAGPAYEGVYIGGTDDYTPTSKNPWAQIFTRDYRAVFGDNGLPAAVPDFYGAGYYDVTFAFWRLYRDVKARGGDVNSGKDLQDALMRNPRFPAVFGGGPGEVGFTELDRVTHGLKHQPIALYQVRNGVPVKIGTSDVKGRNLKLLG